MWGEYLSFHLIKKMGEGDYLAEERFILERIRKERALDVSHITRERKLRKRKSLNRNGRFRFS